MFAVTLRQRCEASGDAPFLLQDDKVITWAGLLDVVTRTATLLHGNGVRPGDRVLLACGNTPTFPYLWFALRWLGATAVPLHNQATGAHVRQVVADAGIEFAAGDTASIERLVADAGFDAGHTLAFATADDLEQAVAGLAAHPLHPAEPDAESSLLYTSGTTGPPKGAVLSDGAFLAGGRELAAAIGIRADDRIMVALPLFHTNPQVYAVMTAIATGCSLALLEKFEPARFLEQAIRYEATGFTYVGTMLAMLVRKLPGDVPPHKLRFCTGGGAPLGLWTTIEDRVGVEVHELYGMTETGGWVTANRLGQRRRGTCGTVRPDMELAILDANDAPVAPGEPGQICVRPREPFVLFDGYHGKSELTLQKFRNLWFHTGDLGAVDDAGYLVFHGRADDMIRRAGENVRPADVEAAIAGHPAVDEVAVVGVPDEVVGQEVRAVIVPRGEFDPLGLPAFLEGKLPRFAWPRYVSVRPALPKTATQKVRSALLRTHESDDADLRGARS
ncbi:class I adenylate-forming enzyme family protein [Amycolatopsis sp. FDAARGOS 1241]|uniref:class I adenylate-forming enzyme family protein n=1 Tax=Amycolatopsis sp. FDAARGOS 1241 TaxID=2778070 RepID=UPI00194FDE58|nr:AMP-binding protein [Amycolatopsis sp. FDAARGOS 1241]QRP43305.1 AMP-binding protein [Amycolatopsis sp. FDAARGOS 1241]